MRETTQAHLREQSTVIAELCGALDHMATDTLSSKEILQGQITKAADKLFAVRDRMHEIEFSESLEWLEDKAGIDA